jgi:hypothetical protein
MAINPILLVSKLGSVRFHDFKFRLNEATLAGRSCGVLIDKTSGAIDLTNSWRDMCFACRACRHFSPEGTGRE